MLTSCKTVLLLTKDNNLIAKYHELEGVCGFKLTVKNEWSNTLRTNHDVIIADTGFIQSVSDVYRDKMVAMFTGSSSDMFRYADRFIFNRNNLQELMYSVMHIATSPIQRSDKLRVVQLAGTGLFQKGKYDFDFVHNRYLYNEKPIHLSNGQATTIANWLLLGLKDNNCCVQLYNLRKKLGSGFLADINKYGELKYVE